MNVLTKDTELLILKPMEIVREYCRLGRKLRTKHNIPTTYPLYEMRINELELDYAKKQGFCLLKDERQLIADELNIDWVEPLVTDHWSKYSEVVSLREGEYYIEMDICHDHYLDRRYSERKEHSERMQERKKAGVKYAD